MVLVADTSPINYLIQIGEIELLPALYGTIHIPDVVLAELSAPGSPVSVLNWVSARPAWLMVETVMAHPIADDSIDAGERAAIQLAMRLGATDILMDDAEARLVAEAERLHVTGTIGVLEAAANREHIDFLPAFQRLLQTNFRISNRLKRLVLTKHGALNR